MADQVILEVLDGSVDGERLLAEFEQRTGLSADVRNDVRYYEIHGDEHRIRLVQTLTDIDPGWTDHLAFRLPA
jgi:hypothetical protein